MKIFRSLTLIMLAVFAFSNTAYSGRTEAIQGKRYKLTNQHGPWMIMVASLQDVEEERRIDGLTAWEAADTIVYELRCKGIPAYTYAVEEQTSELAGASRTPGSSRHYIARQGSISVLAGNFQTNDQKEAAIVLDYIKKKFNSSVITDEKKGGLFARTPGRPTPFSKAFLTINPIYEGEIKSNALEDEVVYLNAGQPYSLLKNKGKYSLQVATFAGGSVMQVGSQSSSKAMALFEQNLGSNLDACYLEAMELAKALRTATKHGYDTDYEAWVFHDQYRSVVTIGSFSSKQDPRIAPLVTLFGGKPAENTNTRLISDDGLLPATFTIPQKPTLQNPVTKQWFFDKQPRIMAVPTEK